MNVRLEFRTAKKSDLKEIIRLLADDELGTKREKYENHLPEAYYNAFTEIGKQVDNQVF